MFAPKLGLDVIETKRQHRVKRNSRGGNTNRPRKMVANQGQNKNISTHQQVEGAKYIYKQWFYQDNVGAEERVNG